MREILFRGKAVGSLKWVEGFYFREAGIFIKELPSAVSTETHMVYEDTIGQYTGLTDKNGRKIFEGDIVVCRQEINGNFIDYHIEIGFVEMKHGAFGLHRKQGYYRPFKDWLEDYEYEVIGNIHDNLELLKGGEG